MDDNSGILKKPRYSKEFKVKGKLEFQENVPNKQHLPAVFLAGVSGISAVVGFGATIASAKKHDPKYFGKGMVATREFPETGANVALRALGWGTLYAFTGCGILFYSLWKLSGANNLEEFRLKMGSILPKIPKNDPPHGRTEFSGINDLLDYLQSEKGSKDT